MKAPAYLGVLLLSLCALAGAQQAPIASAPVIEITGKIDKVQIARGRGMPSIEVKQGDSTTVVRLGSMRYLMEQDFNPKAGEDVTVKGYKWNGEVIAITVRLGDSDKTLRLRDEKGWPVWGRGRGCCMGDTR